MADDQIVSDQRVKQGITPREKLFRYLYLSPWIILILGISLSLAYLKIRYEAPVYQIRAKLLVSEDNSYTNSNEKFNDIFGLKENTRINDQIEIIKSSTMATRVVRRLGLQTVISNKGKFRSTLIRDSEAPIVFEVINVPDSMSSYKVEVNLYDDYFTLVNDNAVQYRYGQSIKHKGLQFRLIRLRRNITDFASNVFFLSWKPMQQAAAELGEGIDAFVATEGTNVLAITYKTENINLGIDVVNHYMQEYQQFNLEDKKETAESALRFIDDQLDNVRSELGDVEQNMLDYRQRNKMYSPEIQGEYAFTEVSNSKKLLIEQRLKLRVSDYLLNYLSDVRNQDKKVSLSLGIEEPALLQLIGEFNRLQIEKETALKTIPSGHPSIKTLDVAILKYRADLLETLKNVRNAQQMLLSDLERQNRDAESLLIDIPRQEKQGLEVARRQAILREIFQFLYQKKVETSIARASTISNIRIMDAAMRVKGLVSPNKRNIYMLAIIFGLGLPAAFIFLLDFLNDKVKNRLDVQNMTDTPIIGEVGHVDGTSDSSLIATPKSRTVVAEQFRIIRSNLAYILPEVEKPMIMVTSTFSGEGKSFISTNLGSVMALAGKKTVVLEFDIRKPKILSGLGLRRSVAGISNYVIGKASLEEIVMPVQGIDNLFIIPCGPVPPNPGELLLNPRIKDMFDWLRKNFDTVIIDTAPIGLVSDSITLSIYADAVVYVVRHDYTNKKQLLFLDELYKNKKLPHLSLVINDISSQPGYGSYTYGGYGYGYGYGYGNAYGNKSESEYFEDDTKRRKKNFWKLLFSKFQFSKR